MTDSSYFLRTLAQTECENRDANLDAVRKAGSVSESLTVGSASLGAERLSATRSGPLIPAR